MPRRQSTGGMWTIAFAVVLGLHVGVAVLALVDFTPSRPNDDGGYMAIDLVAPPTSPASDAPDLPIGSESPEVAATQAANAPPPPPIPDETPPIPAVASEEPMVKAETPPTPPPEEKPPEEVKPEPTPQPQIQSEVQVPSEAMAPPKIEAPVDDHPAAPPIVGKSDADVQARITWIKLLGAHLDRNKRFPSGQRAARRTVEVRIQFKLAADGHVLSTRVLTSSGNAAFDEAALATLTRASPVPPPPASTLAQSSVFNIPIVFRAKD